MNSDYDFDSQWDKFNETRLENGFYSIWSLYKETDSFEDRPFPDMKTIIYKVDGFWGHDTMTLEEEVPENPTWLEIWEAADRLIRQSGDSHHQFVEEFEPVGNGTYNLWTGS